MSEPFGSAYSGCYDALYQEKDYAAECDLVAQLFQAYGERSVSSILDLGCGTGNHALPLAARGFEVIGVDRSESMLAQAQNKSARSAGSKPPVFHQADLREVELHRRFDAVLMMFAVLGYQLKNEDVMAALRAARRHLDPGGLFLFDVWYGPAVLSQRPSDRTKIVPRPGGKVLRFSSGDLDTSRHTCTVRFRLWNLRRDRLLSEVNEEHTVRYFFPLELNLFLQCTGFTSVRLGAFPEFYIEPDEKSWNVLCVARAV